MRANVNIRVYYTVHTYVCKGDFTQVTWLTVNVIFLSDQRQMFAWVGKGRNQSTKSVVEQ